MITIILTTVLAAGCIALVIGGTAFTVISNDKRWIVFLTTAIYALIALGVGALIELGKLAQVTP